MYTTTYPRMHASGLSRSLPVVLMLLAALTTFAAQRPLVVPHMSPGPTVATVTPDISQLPLAFAPSAANEGFQVRGRDSSLFFMPGEVRLVTADGADQAGTVVSLRFEGANPTSTPAGAERLPGAVNYLLGNEPANWETRLPTYAGIVYKGLYPGVDLSYTGAEGQLSGAFVVAPGADPRVIRLRYDSATAVDVDQATGELRLDGALLAPSPRAWQTVDGRRVPVTVRYVMSGASGGSGRSPRAGGPSTPPASTLGFALGAYNPARPLTVAPAQSFSSTRFGGSLFEDGDAIAIDPAGNIYLFGSTNSTDLPTLNPYQPALAGSQDSFVAKFDPTGRTLLYSTYLGGSGPDYSEGIAVDSAGNVFLSGRTDSANFPVVNAVQASLYGTGDAFVSKLDASGASLVYSTYIGGGGIDTGEGITLDGAGNVIVTGTTRSPAFPLVNALQTTFGGLQDAFVVKLNPNGRAVFSTYLGGSDYDGGRMTGTDPEGNVYVVGRTRSLNFPTANPLHPANASNGDVFITKLDPTGAALLYSTYLGGAGDDIAVSLIVDDAGNPYITGRTSSADFPTANALQPELRGLVDAFVTKIDASGSALSFSTYLGGSDGDRGEGIGLDDLGNIYIAGGTQSPDLPVVNPVQGTFGGSEDTLIAKLDATGSTIRFSTYHGGPAFDTGRAIAVNGAGTVYVTGITNSFGLGGQTFVTIISNSQ